MRRVDPAPQPVGRFTTPSSPGTSARGDAEQSTAARDIAQEGGPQARSEREVPANANANGNGNGKSAQSPATGEPAYDLHHDDLSHDDDLDSHDDVGHGEDIDWHDEAATGEFAAQGYTQQPAPAAAQRPVPEPVTSSPGPEPEQGPARRRATKSIGGRGAPVVPAAAADGAAAGPPTGRGRRPLALALFLVPVIAVVWFLASLFQPFGGDGEGAVSVTIPEGASVAEIGDILAEEGVVDSSLFFRLRATVSGDGAALRSGPHELRRDMSYASAITALSTPPPAAGAGEVVDVTIPEGLSRSEIAPVVEEAGVDGDYVEASLGQKGFSAEDYGAPEDTDSLEGFLFPSTYELSVEDNAEDLVSKQLEAFQENFSQVDLSKAEEGNLTPYEVLIIASMVERETRVPEERPLVAAVIYNRLSEGMPLGIDATIRYANDNWDSPLKQSELKEDGPYNTRTRTGLPPTPIGNPGLSSIKAAANPADKDFLYYVVKPGTCGEHNFSDSDAEFQQDVAEYNRARDAAGGNSPTTC